MIEGITISVEDDPPPIVTAMARDLEACLEDPAFADETRRISGVVGVRSARTPEAVSIAIADGEVSLAHGTSDEAALIATAELGGDDGEPRVEGHGEPELERWMRRILNPPTPRWPEAAERFWSVLSRMPGAPTALLVVETAAGEERRLGAGEGRTCELHGSAAGLLGVLTGRVSAMEAAFDGTVRLRGTFPDLSVLTGAGFEIRYGGVGRDG